jgi:hypothetical protein
METEHLGLQAPIEYVYEEGHFIVNSYQLILKLVDVVPWL